MFPDLYREHLQLMRIYTHQALCMEPTLSSEKSLKTSRNTNTSNINKEGQNLEPLCRLTVKSSLWFFK